MQAVSHCHVEMLVESPEEQMDYPEEEVVNGGPEEDMMMMAWPEETMVVCCPMPWGECDGLSRGGHGGDGMPREGGDGELKIQTFPKIATMLQGPRYF